MIRYNTSPPPLKILLAEGSSLSARQTLFSLGPRHKIDVLDSSPICQCRFSKYVRNFYRGPRFAVDPLGYLRVLSARLKAEKYDVLIAPHEQVYLLSRVREKLGEHVGVALPNFAAMEQLQSKAGFARILKQLEIGHPQTELLAKLEELDQVKTFPFWLKLAFGTAGNGVWHIRSQADLDRVKQQIEKAGGLHASQEILIQQPARGVQGTVQAVFQKGRLVASHCFQALATGVGGMSTVRISSHQPPVAHDLEKLGAALEWHGPMFLDCFFDPDTGHAEYIEANPRIGETVNATLSGLNLCDVLLRVSLGEEVDPQPPGAAGIRTHSGFMILASAAMEGSSRWQLVSEWWRMRSRAGSYLGSEDELTRVWEDPLSAIPSFGMYAQIMTSPSLAALQVNRTVKNYALSEAAAESIRDLPQTELDACFN